MAKHTTISTILLLGLLHAGRVCVVESFSSTQKPSWKVATIPQQQPQLLQQQQQKRDPWSVLPRSSGSALGVATATEDASDVSEENGGLPEFGTDGLWHITSEAEYKAVLENNKDKLIVLKVFAPWCKACKGLAPKFQGLVRDEKYKGLPIVWADLNIQGNKDFVKSIGVLALPTVQLYAGNGAKVDTFPCGPSKVPILKRKLIQLVNEHVDAKTRLLKPSDGVVAVATEATEEAAQDAQNAASAETAPSAEETVKDVVEREKTVLRSNKYLSELLESEYEDLMTHANLLTFEAGSIIMREGNMGRTFYIILEGEVEICQRTSFEDPLTTPPSYLGTVINQFTNKGDFFGERSLITGEPRAASIRASSRTKCLAFDKGSFPKSNILSGFGVSPEVRMREMEDINDKYGVFTDMGAINDEKQYRESIQASQVRGSANQPGIIAGVDTDEEDVPTQEQQSHIVDDPSTLGVGTETMVPLLMRLKLIRSITRCFDYTVKYKLKFGDPGSRRRRNILLNVLAPMQRTYIEDAFNLVDEDGSESINLMELRRVMDSVGERRSDDELLGVIESKNAYAPWQDQSKTITKEDFFGLMAEAETYQLFIDTFKTLDPQDSGFVRAKDLDRILCGVRDLISDDRKSIIDVEDIEMMVDYEQFSRMLLGTTLKV
jgi:calmodulin